jgi:hypothetical protein
MSAIVVACPRCQNSLPGALCNTETPVECPACENTILVAVFPALFRSSSIGSAGETILEEGVSSCFYHEQKKAVIHCDGCGRFLCALCDLEVNGQHLCPSCLQAGKKKGAMPQLENRRTLHDQAALTLCVCSVIFGPLIFLTGPIAIYLAVLSWFRPSSLIPRTKIRAYFAIVFALIQMAGWALAFAQ